MSCSIGVVYSCVKAATALVCVRLMFELWCCYICAQCMHGLIRTSTKRAYWHLVLMINKRVVQTHTHLSLEDPLSRGRPTRQARLAVVGGLDQVLISKAGQMQSSWTTKTFEQLEYKDTYSRSQWCRHLLAPHTPVVNGVDIYWPHRLTQAPCTPVVNDVDIYWPH